MVPWSLLRFNYERRPIRPDYGYRRKKLVRIQQPIEYLKSNKGRAVAYDHDPHVVILPRGKFIAEPLREHTVLAYGEIQELLEELRKSLPLNSDKIE